MERAPDLQQSDADPPGGQPAPPMERYPPDQSFSLQALLQRWRAVLLHPSVATFDAQQPTAN
ncbi:MAG TPA: hypothetical protein VF120_08780 [Ktedonobacterales bacterium]